MRWSIYLGRPLGIRVYLHFTFVLLMALLWWASWRAHGSITLPLFTLTCFFCVLLHEYGHALMARHYGIGTHDITLLPIGGVARLERMPTKPSEELLVALAGPAVNVAIALLLVPVCLLLGQPVVPDLSAFFGGHSQPGLASMLLSWNIVMILFNMMPAFPMDGGRVLRALLAMRLPYDRATAAAAAVGRAMAVVFALYAIFYSSNPLLIVIAFFVWTGAGTEAAAAIEQTAIEGASVADAMLVEFTSLRPEDTAADAARLILRSYQTDFPVLESGHVTGVVTRSAVVTALAISPDRSAREMMLPLDASCLAGEVLEGVIQRMRELQLPLLPVLRNGSLCGLVTPDNTAEFIAFRRALRLRLDALGASHG